MAPTRRRGRAIAKNAAALSDEEASDYESAPPVKSSRNSASASEVDDASTKPRRNGRAARKDLKEVDDDVDIDEDVDVKDADEEDEEDEEGLEDDVYAKADCCVALKVRI